MLRYFVLSHTAARYNPFDLTREPSKSPLVAESESSPSVSRIQLMVGGMDCSSCSQAVKQKVSTMPGVTIVNVSSVTGVAQIFYDSGSTFTVSALIESIKSLGYSAEEMEENSSNSVEFVLTQAGDMSQLVIDKLLVRSMLMLECETGVIAESVVHRIDEKSGQRSLRLEFDPDVTGPRRLLAKLMESGCQFQLASSNHSSGVDSAAMLKRQWSRRFWLSAAFCIPVIFIAFIFPLIGGSLTDAMEYELTSGLSVAVLLLFLLSSPIQLFIGWPLYESAYRSLRYGRSANADLLVVLSTSVAYFYSIISVIVGMAGAQFTDENFFETSAVLLTLIILGRYMEAIAKGKTSQVLDKLQAMTVTQATLLVDYDKDSHTSVSEVELDMTLIERGDIIKVLPGTRVATDGLVVWGSTMIDESMVTGESISVLKQVGDSVLSSTVNESGLIHIQVTRTSSENTLSSITRLVQEAQNSQPPVQRVADRVAAWFVPAILVLTVGVFIVWISIAASGHVDTDGAGSVTFALRFAIATLIVSCPCAIGLAVPTAIMAGSGVAAEHGVVFKSGATIERCAKVSAIVLDKTGTLTRGKPKVTSYLCVTELGELHSDFWRYVGAAESGSEHPLAAALLAFAKVQIGLEPNSDQPIPGNAPESFESVPGRGIRCVIDGHRICIGTMAWIEQNLTVSAKQQSILAGQRPSAETRVLVSIDDQLQAVVYLMDELKPGARQLIQHLRKLNIDTWMCSGDSQETALMIGLEAGLSSDRILGGQLPGDKATLIRQLQSEGHVVSMVGDGINDSPALAQADVGMAVAQGTDIAGEAAHVLLIKDDLLDIALALQLARRTFKTIRWNFIWAFFYNFLAIPIAMGVFYPLAHISIPPPLAGLSELLSSLPVVIFSLMLRFYRPPKSVKFNSDLKSDLEMTQLLTTVTIEAPGSTCVAD